MGVIPSCSSSYLIELLGLYTFFKTITELSSSLVQRAYFQYCKAKHLEGMKETYRKLVHMWWFRFFSISGRPSETVLMPEVAIGLM